MLYGGNLNNGGNAGPFYSNLNNGVGTANWNYGALGVLSINCAAYILTTR